MPTETFLSKWVWKFEYTLPVTQVAVAVFLWRQTELWRALTRHMDMPGPGAAARVLDLINLPIAVLRGVWWRAFDVYRPDWIFVAMLAVFWYWVGREIESRLARRTPLAIKAQLARIAVDALLTVSSLLFVFFGSADFRWFPWWYFVPAVVFSLVWIFVPPFLLCFDLFSIVRPRKMSL
jgi:hypothetical protein